MLVLSRQPEEVVCIGPDIEVRVLSVRGDKVSLGFTAPPGVRLLRKELVVDKSIDLAPVDTDPART